MEEVLNEIVADQAVFRLTLQCFLLRMLAARPELAAHGLTELSDQVLRSIGRIRPSAADAAGGERWKRLAARRAEAFFVELEDALGQARAPADPTAAQ